MIVHEVHTSAGPRRVPSWFVEPSRHRVVAGKPHVATVLGYSPDGRKLWVLGERSRVSALSPTA